MSGMLRILASAVIVLGGGYIGLLLAAGLDTRVRQLEQSRMALTQMEFNIGFLKMPVVDALCGAAKTRRGAVAALLSSAASEIEKSGISPSSAFERAVLKNRRFLSMTKDDIDILTEFASGLGRGDVDSELCNIKATCAKLKAAQNEAEGERDKKGRLWRGMGLLGGMLAVVLLF